MWKRSFFLLVEEPEGFPETDIGIFLAKVADDLLSLPKTKVIVSIALSLTEERKLKLYERFRLQSKLIYLGVSSIEPTETHV